MKEYSKSWVSSKKPKKQRKYLKKAPLHKRQKIMKSNLSKDLRKKFEKRSVTVRKGDTVKILRGKFKGKIAKVQKVNRRDYKLLLEGIIIEKKDGTKINFPIHYSNVQLIELDLEDKLRFKNKKIVKTKKQENKKEVVKKEPKTKVKKVKKPKKLKEKKVKKKKVNK